MAASDIQTAALGLVALAAGFLVVIITLVALLPALTEAALGGARTNYDKAARGAMIERHLRSLRLQIPLFCLAILCAMAAWAAKCLVVVIVATGLTVAGLIWLSLVAYAMSASLGKFLIEADPRSTSAPR